MTSQSRTLRITNDVMDSLDVRFRVQGMDNIDTRSSLSYMDSPLLDNITVSHQDGGIDHFAVMLLDIRGNEKEHKVELEFLHFPMSFYSPFDVRMETLQKLAGAPPG